jgi:fucose permease
MSSHLITAATIAGGIVFGMLLVLPGALQSSWVKTLQLGDLQTRRLRVIFPLTFILMMVLAGELVDTIGPRAVMFLGSMASAFALAGLGWSQSYRRDLGFLILSAVGAACLGNVTVVLMQEAFFSESAVASQNLGQVFISLAGMATPWLASFLLARTGYRRGLNLLALLCLVPALLLGLSSGQLLQGVEGSPGAVLHDPAVWLAALVFFLYGPLESCLGLWTTRYLSSFRLSPLRVRWLCAAFWLCFLGSRIAVAFLAARGILAVGLEVWLIVGLSLGFAVCLGNMAGTHSAATARLGLLIVGLFLGPILPTLIGVLLAHSASQPGTAYGAMYTLGAAGTFFVPAKIAGYLENKPAQRAMHIPMVIAIGLGVASLLLGLFHQ